MKLNVYSIYDTKANAYAQPFYSQTDGSAIRAFSDHANEKGTPANKHPDDYILFRIGTYDDETGVISDDEHRQLGTARNYLIQE